MVRRRRRITEIYPPHTISSSYSAQLQVDVCSSRAFRKIIGRGNTCISYCRHPAGCAFLGRSASVSRLGNMWDLFGRPLSLRSTNFSLPTFMPPSESERVFPLLIEALFALGLLDAGIRVLAVTETEVAGFGPGTSLALNTHSKPFELQRMQGVDPEHLICGAGEPCCAGQFAKSGQWFTHYQ